MSSFDQDKLTERDRYDYRAKAFLLKKETNSQPNGAISVPLTIRKPYNVYEDFIRDSVKPGDAVLDVCCGTGIFSLVGVQQGADVTASDIAETNLVVAQLRASKAGLQLKTVVADAERLPFPNGSFDVITCAGSLSYLDLNLFLEEIRRLLRPGGWFICVDSLNHNPVYRFNRFLQYVRGKRTRATVKRMPTMATVVKLHEKFNPGESRFYGYVSFLAPAITLFLEEQRAAQALDNFDAKHPNLKRWAFKFVFRGRR